VTVTARSLVLAAVVAALVIVGAASAANSASYNDAQGDVGFAPDVTSVTMSNTDAGTVTVRVAFDKVLPFTSADELAIALDVDQNPDTGSVLYGTDVAIAFEGSRLVFFRASGAYFDEAPKPATVTGTLESNAAVFTFNAADVGLTPTAGFNVVVDGYSDLGGETDTAPDIRTANYELVAGTPAVVPGADTRAPVDHAYKSSGKHGKRARLWFEAADGRGATADTIRIYRGKRVLKTISYSLDDTNPYFTYYADWKVPKKVRGKLRFCVASRDAAGNQSNTSCAALTIK
jgi:hypothetical protein